MADFQDEILATYKGESDPVFELVTVDTNEYKLVLKNTISQAGTPFANSNVATNTEILDKSIGNKIITPKALDGALNTITAGETVAIGNALFTDKSTGKAKKFTFDADIPDLINLMTGAQPARFAETYSTDNENVKLAIYFTSTTDLKCRLIDISDIDSPSLKTQYTVKNSSSAAVKTVQLNDTEVIVLLHAAGASTNIDMYHLSINTTTFAVTVTENLAVLTDSVSTTSNTCSPARISDSTFAVAYSRTSDTYIKHVSVSGSTITAGAGVQFDTSTRYLYQAGVEVASNVVMFSFSNSTIRCAYWTGSTFTLGTIYSPNLTYNTTVYYRVADNVIGYVNNTSDYVGTITVDGSYDCTHKARCLTEFLNNVYNVAYDNITQKLYVITYATTSAYQYSIYVFKISSDGKVGFEYEITSSNDDYYSTSSPAYGLENDFYYNSISFHRNKTNTNLVVAKFSANASNYKQAIRIIPALDKFEEFIGLTAKAGATDDVIVYKVSGTLKNLTGLTAGSDYYIQEDGTIGTSETQFKIGTATSTTELSISKDFKRVL